MSRPRLVSVVLLSAVAAWSAAVGCTGEHGKSNPWPAGKSPRLLASFPPIYCFVANVAGDNAAVVSLIESTGPHDFQPTVQDALKVRGADMFFLNGLELETAFADKIVNPSGNTKLTLVELARAVPDKIKVAGHESHEEHAGHHHHHHGEYDPHVWLGLPEAVKMVERTRDELKKKYPASAQGYDELAAAYIEKLQKLHKDSKERLAGIKPEQRKLISFHDALRYFARSIDFQVVGVVESSPGQRPSPQEFRQLVKVCKETGARVIALEPQYDHPEVVNDLLAKLKAEGIDAVKVVVNPMETAPADFGPDYYEKTMRENVDRLVEALK